MNQHVDGILNERGTVNVTNSAVGPNARVDNHAPLAAERTGDGQDRTRCDVGVITILPQETQAVKRVLGLRRQPIGDLGFYTGTVEGSSVVATMALSQGQRSATAAYQNLVQYYDPEIVVLTGIGGGFHKNISIGDVLIATEMVYYDLRKVTPGGTRPRGEERTAPAAVGHALNSFLTDHDPPVLEIEDPSGTVRKMTVHTGPIGSGDAVIAHEGAEELALLASFNDKILGVDMEAGGLSQACHERSAGSGRQHQWAVVRGISDKAGSQKNDEHQRIASWHAARVLEELIPYLRTRR